MSRFCDIAYCTTCEQAVLHRVAEVRGLTRAVRNGKDVEAVHDMRVASRRLRAALALFEPCLPSQARACRKKVGSLTGALGRARDLDVQIATVEALRRKPARPSWKVGLEYLLDGLRRDRRAAQGEVVRALARMERSGTLRKVERLLKGSHARLPDDADFTEARRLAGTTILGLLKKLKSYEFDLARPKAIARHHAMRIAAKRLRYSLEVFEPMYGPSLTPVLRCAKALQTLLGDLHDCDVWAKFLSGVLSGELNSAAEDAKTIQWLTDGIEEFRKDRVRRRKTLHRQCRRYWRQCRKKRIWPKLREIIAAPSVHGSVRRLPAKAQGVVLKERVDGHDRPRTK